MELSVGRQQKNQSRERRNIIMVVYVSPYFLRFHRIGESRKLNERKDDGMGYRRLFIMRKDLHMSAGKLAAQVGHCAEAYWLRLIRKSLVEQGESERGENHVAVGYFLPNEMVDEYINGAIVKTICEAKSKAHLLKAKSQAEELGLVEDQDFGLIHDKCLTELEPEEEDGTTLTGIWFKPLPDATAHQISRKYHLYM